VLDYIVRKIKHRVHRLTYATFSTRHDNDNCDLTIQAVANVKPAFVDVPHKLRERYSNIQQIHWSDDLSFGPIAAR